LLYEKECNVQEIPTPPHDVLERILNKAYSNVHTRSYNEFEVFVKNIITDLLEYKRICKNTSANTSSAIKPKEDHDITMGKNIRYTESVTRRNRSSERNVRRSTSETSNEYKEISSRESSIESERRQKQETNNSPTIASNTDTKADSSYRKRKRYATTESLPSCLSPNNSMNYMIFDSNSKTTSAINESGESKEKHVTIY